MTSKTSFRLITHSKLDPSYVLIDGHFLGKRKVDVDKKQLRRQYTYIHLTVLGEQQDCKWHHLNRLSRFISSDIVVVVLDVSGNCLRESERRERARGNKRFSLLSTDRKRSQATLQSQWQKENPLARSPN